MKQKILSRHAFSGRVKKYCKYQAILALLLVALFYFSEKAHACRAGIMIYEIYGGGGNSRAAFKNDFIVLYNSSSSEVSLDGWAIQYASSSGDFTASKRTNLTGNLPKGKFYLIKEASGGSEGVDLPASEAVGNMNLSSSGAKVALVKGDALINSLNDNDYVDIVRYGGTASDRSVYRKNETCLDTDNYGNDFDDHYPEPKNTSFVKVESNICKSGIHLNEAYPFKGEFVEVLNGGEKECSLEGWWISDEKDDTKSPSQTFGANSLIGLEEYLVLEADFGLNSTSEDFIRLFDPTGKEVEKIPYPKPDGDFSYSRNDEEKWEWTEKTPGKKNVFPEKKEFSTKMIITELFPNPFKSQYEEYIELFNGSEKDVDLKGWMLHDASKSGKYVFPENLIVKTKEYLTIFKKDFKFALNNSGNESVFLINPNGETVSNVSYDGSKKNISYNFNGNIWKWSKFLTPGKENVFNNEPSGKIKLPDEVYENIWADFSISTKDADGEKVKVTWNFGDGHKSYKEKTRHKYEAEGTYKASVKYSDDSEDVVREFEVKVKKFPELKIRIAEVNPNPEGSDTENETITIENKSKKKVNLIGWSIATGWKKFINHPIREDFIIEKGKTKILTREISSFTLNNKKDKIELSYPNGEVASKLKYKKEEGIEEGDVYRKVKGGWEWTQTKITNDKLQIPNNLQNTINNNQMVDEENWSQEEDLSLVTGLLESYSPEALNDKIDLREKVAKKLDVEFLKNHSEIEILNNANVIEGRIIREENGQYYFTPVASEKEHYAITFANNLADSVNEKLNSLFNGFSN